MGVPFLVRSTADGRTATIDVAPQRVILGGFSARSREDRQRHVDELRQIGVEPPVRMPIFWPVGANLLTTETEIQVQGAWTSGEVEYALLAHGGRTYVALASDQTDRQFEAHSIPRSKQLCAKVLSTDVLPIGELRTCWDEIIIASDVSVDGLDWRPYQRSTLAAMMDPDALVRSCFGKETTEELTDGTILLSGTVPLLDGETKYLPHFRARMEIPDSSVRLFLAYRVVALPELALPEVGAGAAE